jgi:probable rRNA maturation factor
VDLQVESLIDAADAKQLAADLRRVVGHATDLPLPDEVAITVVDDQSMTDLHERVLGDPSTTDVMSFETEHREDGSVATGELVVCHDEAVRQAAERGHDARLELLLYALHGLLHLSGFDDLTPDEHRRMHEMEDRLLVAAGFEAAFARDA